MKNDGGSAFPLQGNNEYDRVSGMSLRDYFAAKAMQGILSNLDLSKEIRLNGEVISVSVLSYLQADAMLKYRDENGK